MQLQRVYRKLEQESFRVTPQRDRVVQAFARHPDEALSAEDVERLVRQEQAEPVGLATIYRTIDILVHLSLIGKIPSADGRARYRLSRDALAGPHHLVCVRCGQVEEVLTETVREISGRILSRQGFLVQDADLKFYGVCPGCAESGAVSP